MNKTRAALPLHALLGILITAGACPSNQHRPADAGPDAGADTPRDGWSADGTPGDGRAKADATNRQDAIFYPADVISIDAGQLGPELPDSSPPGDASVASEDALNSHPDAVTPADRGPDTPPPPLSDARIPDSAPEALTAPNDAGAPDATDASVVLVPDAPPNSDTGSSADTGPICTPTTWYRDLDGDGWGDTSAVASACTAPAAYVAVGDDCDDIDPLRHPGPAPDPGFVYSRCGQGLVADPMNSPAGWAQYLSTDDGSGSGSMATEPGSCLGDNGLVFSYDLPSPSACGSAQCSWVIMRKEYATALDLSAEDYLVFPFNGDAGDPNLNIDVKLQDTDQCMIGFQIRNATDLPVKRAMLIPLKFYSMARSGGCSVNLSAVHAMEIGVVGQPPSGSDFPDDTGRLHLDAITALKASELRMTAGDFTCPGADTGVRPRIAQDLLARHKSSLSAKGHPLVPSWFEEGTNNYWSYNQALLLMVFSLEAARTGHADFKSAAVAVADQLIELQKAVISDPGRWYDVYQDNPSGSGLVGAGDLRSWVGNTSWVILSLDLFRGLLKPAAPQPYDVAIDLAAQWLGQQIDAYGTNGGITDGTEGNVSAFFALVAAKRFARAGKLKDYLLTNLWHADEQRFWMGLTYPGLAIDVIGNWGSEFLRAVAETSKALVGLQLAAGIFPAPSFDGAYRGLGDIAGPFQPTVEFSAQAISAGIPGSPSLLGEILKLEKNGTFPGAPDDFDGGDGWNTKWHGIAPSAWVYLALSPESFALHRWSLPIFADDFESDLGWGTFEELVDPTCYAQDIGEVSRSTVVALSGTASLSVWANKSTTSKSNHLIANKKILAAGQTGVWRLEFDAYVPADSATKCQTGPEASLQNTRLLQSGSFATSTMGVQYVANAADASHGWGVWAEISPGVAKWTHLNSGPLLAPDRWYHIVLTADFDTNRYVSLRVEDTLTDLSGYKIAAEPKFTEEAFWVTLESENLWSNCGLAAPSQCRVFYDNLVVQR